MHILASGPELQAIRFGYVILDEASYPEEVLKWPVFHDYVLSDCDNYVTKSIVVILFYNNLDNSQWNCRAPNSKQQKSHK